MGLEWEDKIRREERKIKKREEEAFVSFMVRLEAMWRGTRVDYQGRDERYCIEKVREKL